MAIRVGHVSLNDQIAEVIREISLRQQGKPRADLCTASESA